MKQFQQYALSIISLLCLLILPADAKVRVTKTNSPTMVPMTGANVKFKNKVDTEGYDVLIREVNGETQVLVDENQDGIFNDNPSDANNEIIDNEDISWSSIAICVGGEICSAGHTTNVTMTGGDVYGIAPFSSKANRTISAGHIVINVTGGTVGSFFQGEGFDFARKFDPQTAKLSIRMSNANYDGDDFPAFTFVNDTEQEMDCIFDNSEVILTNVKYRHPEIIDNIKYFGNARAFYVNGDGSAYRAFGTITIPADVNVRVDSVTLKDANTHVTNLGTVRLTCNGTINLNGGTWEGNKIENEHVFRHKIIKPTCKRFGSEVDYCIYCNKSVLTSLVPKLNHEYIEEPAVEPTCTTAGRTSCTYCKYCGDVTIRSMILEPVSHNWEDTNNILLLRSTYFCNTASEGKYQQCSVCNRYRFITTDESNTNHSYGDWVTDNNGTCKVYGTKTRRCTHTKTIGKATYQCNARETAINFNVAPKHIYGLITPTKEATCTEEGYEAYYTCGYCGKYLDSDKNDIDQPVIIPKLDHEYSGKQISENTLTKEANCTKPNEYRYSCSTCGTLDPDESHVFYDGQKLGHQYEIESVYPSELEPLAGTATLHCTVCDDKMENFAYTATSELTLPVFSSTVYNCVLDSVVTEPSCQPGAGIYNLHIKYEGCKMDKKFRAPILPIYYTDGEGYAITDQFRVHEWAADGTCPHHESEKTVGYYKTKVTEPIDGAVVRYTHFDGMSYTDLTAMSNSESLWTTQGEADIHVLAEYTLDPTRPFPYDFTATNVRYERAVKSNSIETAIFPAALPLSCINGKVYKLADYNPNTSVFIFEEYTEENLKVNTPYIIKVNDGASSLVDNTKLINTPVSMSGGSNQYYPTVDASPAYFLANQTGYYYECTPQQYKGNYEDYYYLDTTLGKCVKCEQSTSFAPFTTSFCINTEYGTPKSISLQLGTEADAPIITIDINDDGRIDISDMTTIIGILSGDFQSMPADVNGDGVVDTKDVDALAKKILQK